MRASAGAITLGLLALAATRSASAAPPVDPAYELKEGERQLAAANASSSPSDKVKLARAAASHFEAASRATGEWSSAARASEAYLTANIPPLASAWYWIAAEGADYSESYLTWQKGALDRVFGGRASITLDPNQPIKTAQVDGASLPYDAIGRPIALDPGTHRVAATSDGAAVFQGSVVLSAGDVGKTKFFPVTFQTTERPDEIRADKKYPRRPNDGGFSALRIVTIVATTTLATGIAVGGGYLLFGSENPHGLDSPQGVAIVSTEVLLIAAGVTIALIAD